MKNFISILLAFVFLGNVLSLPLYYLYYNLNTAYITDMFCINKDNTALKCHGKCHLSKVTEDLMAPDQDQPNPRSNFEKRIPISLFVSEIQSFPNLTPPFSGESIFFHADHYHFYHLQSIFQPPDHLEAI